MFLLLSAINSWIDERLASCIWLKKQAWQIHFRQLVTPGVRSQSQMLTLFWKIYTFTAYATAASISNLKRLLRQARCQTDSLFITIHFLLHIIFESYPPPLLDKPHVSKVIILNSISRFNFKVSINLKEQKSNKISQFHHLTFFLCTILFDWPLALLEYSLYLNFVNWYVNLHSYIIPPLLM